MSHQKFASFGSLINLSPAPLVRLGLYLIALTPCLGVLNCSWAQNYPTRPIRVIVPYAAGGYSDQISRILAENIGKTLGQPLILEAKAGGGGRIGAEAITKLPPDGHDLLMTTNGTHTYMAVTEKNLSYDPIKDFTPISLIGTYGLLMVVNPSVPLSLIHI